MFRVSSYDASFSSIKYRDSFVFGSVLGVALRRWYVETVQHAPPFARPRDIDSFFATCTKTRAGR